MAYSEYTAQFPTSLVAASDLLKPNTEDVQTTLYEAITSGSPAEGGNLRVNSATNFSSSGGVIRVNDSEIMVYSTKGTDGTSDYLTLLYRGVGTSSAASASAGDAVEEVAAAEYVKRLITEMIPIETKIGTGSSTPVTDSVLAGTGAGTSSWDTTPKVVGQDIQEGSSDLASPSAGYRRLFARDSGGLVTLDSDSNRNEIEFAGGRVLQISPPTVIALTKAGAFSDTDVDADGFIGIDKTNNRIYYRHSGGTWKYVASLVDQAEMNLTTAADATKEAVRYDEFSAEHTAADGTHGDITPTSVTNIGQLDQQEESSDLASPSAGYRRIFARDSGGLVTLDSDGNRHEVEFAGGKVLSLAIEPTPTSWQHKAAATGSQYGALRIEWGNDTLSAGTKAITFQQAFTGILDVFVQDKTAANAMYPSGIGTSGFTANGTTTDTFAWLAVGYD